MSLQEEQKRAYAGQRESVRRNDNQEHAGVPVWEATPPNLEVETTPASAPAKRSRKKTIAKAPAKKTAKRTAAARRKPTMPRKKAMRRRTSRRRATS